MENYNNLQTQTPQTEQKKPMKRYLALQIIPMVLLALLTALLTYVYVDIITDTSELKGIGIALFLIVYVILLGGAVNIVSLILSIIGLALTLKKCPKKGRTGQVITFSILVALPIIIEAIFIVLCIYYNSIAPATAFI